MFGRTTKLQGTLSTDFEYAGYYLHGPSGLDLTLTRAYKSVLTRWLSRDLAHEGGGINLYSYCSNNPVLFNDPSGLLPGGGSRAPWDPEYPPNNPYNFEPNSRSSLKQCKTDCDNQANNAIVRLSESRPELIREFGTEFELDFFTQQIDFIESANVKCRERCDDLFPDPGDGTPKTSPHNSPICPMIHKRQKRDRKKAA